LIAIKAECRKAAHASAMTTAAQRRAYDGPVLFSYGFRPFFLFGSIWSALVVPLWIWSYLGGGPDALTRDWHVHEMLFGFLSAVVAGFLTTAVPNWTGRMPVIGWPLGALVGLWSAGRIVMVFSAALGPVAAAIDSLFLVAFAAIIWREILAGRNWRNLPVCGLVTLLALGNIAFHLKGRLTDADLGVRAALSVAAVLITLIGGRIIPSFSRNWMKVRQMKQLPAEFDLEDTAALVLTPLAGAAWTFLPGDHLTGPLLLLAGLASLLRLARWRGWQAWREPLVWILHVGYGWLAVGLILLAFSVLDPSIPRSAGIHALTAGAVGVMTLAVMTRATRGHTGRPLTADPLTIAIYAAVNLAALVRVAAPFSASLQEPLLMASAALWTLAFGGFAAVYSLMLAAPRPAVAAAAA
jgi:uncharacterized protein involved in response to NO